jgi:hypothetical protein
MEIHNKMTSSIKLQLNLLADMMLMVDGYESSFGVGSGSEVFDYSTSTLPRDQKAWNKSVTAYSFLNKVPEMLQNQVNITAKNIFAD